MSLTTRRASLTATEGEPDGDPEGEPDLAAEPDGEGDTGLLVGT